MIDLSPIPDLLKPPPPDYTGWDPCHCLIADPAWPEKNRMIPPAPKESRGGARAHYKYMQTLDEICAFPMPPMQDDCWLFLWATERHSRGQAQIVAKAWGFKPTGSALIWVKLQQDEDTPVFGMGYYFRISHEHLVLFKRGRPKPMDRSIRSVFGYKRGEHSEKPTPIYDLVERFAGPGQFSELFARERREGWQQYGNQLEEE